MPDPDSFALAFMVRAALRELARIKNPENPGRELERIGGEILRAVRETPFRKEAGDREEDLRKAIFESVMHLMKLGGDRRVQ